MYIYYGIEYTCYRSRSCILVTACFDHAIRYLRAGHSCLCSTSSSTKHVVHHVNAPCACVFGVSRAEKVPWRAC